MWNLQGQLIATLKHDDGVSKVIFKPDGKSVLTTSYENAKLWNLKGQEIATFKNKHLEKAVFSLMVRRLLLLQVIVLQILADL
ncbi:hypothetical protein [Nostoc sp.]|uniref:hypothetical protein n=1 Tax=Nostoc sp. JL23 TaxID=2815394 RepID=UPI002FFBD00E